MFFIVVASFLETLLFLVGLVQTFLLLFNLVTDPLIELISMSLLISLSVNCL